MSKETCVKFFGVLLDSTLSWKPHFTELSKKLSRTAGLLYKIRHYTPIETLKLLYLGIFYPFLSYGVQVWGLTYPTLLNPVFILQKKAVKAMTFSDIMTPSLPLFNNSQLLRLSDISNLQLASFVFECVNGLSPQFFENYFTSIASKHGIFRNMTVSTRGNLFLERQHTIQYRITSVQYSGAKLWNSIPSEIRLSSTVKQFRTKLKKHYLKS